MSKWHINYMNDKTGTVDKLERVEVNGVVGYRIRWTDDNDAGISAGYEEVVPRIGLLNIIPLKEGH